MDAEYMGSNALQGPVQRSFWFTGSVAVLIAFIVFAYRHFNNPLNKIPGPWLTQYTNLPLKIATITGRRIFYVHAIQQRYGPIARIAPNEVAVADVAAHKTIHAFSSGYEKSPVYKILVAPEREGVFVMTSKPHAIRRRLLSRPFSKTHLRKTWEDTVRRKVQLTISSISRESASGPVDILKWFTFMASDISTKLMFGQDFQTLERGEVSQYIRTLLTTVTGRVIGAELPPVKWIGSRLPFKSCQALFRGEEVLGQYGRLAVKNLAKDPHGANIFGQLAEEVAKGEKLDDLDIEVEAQNLIVAGTDTTSVTLTYLIWSILSRPDLQQKIEAEIRSLPHEFQETDVEKLELLDAVIQETLRLYSAAQGGTPRLVPAQGAVLGGFAIPGGTTVTTQAFSLHRDERLFPDPDSFIPERWLKSSETNAYGVSKEALSVFTPYGAGSRACIGLHLANMTMRLAAAEFFRTFPGARLASSTTPESMRMTNYALIAPAAHRCEVVVG